MTSLLLALAIVLLVTALLTRWQSQRHPAPSAGASSPWSDPMGAPPLWAELSRQTRAPSAHEGRVTLMPIYCHQLYGRQAREAYDASREVDLALLAHLQRVPEDLPLAGPIHDDARRARRALITAALDGDANDALQTLDIEDLRRRLHAMVASGR